MHMAQSTVNLSNLSVCYQNILKIIINLEKIMQEIKLKPKKSQNKIFEF